MNQKFSIALFASGLPTFIYTMQHVLHQHTSWNEFATPAGLGDALAAGGSFVSLIIGALGIRLGSPSDREHPPVSDPGKDGTP